MKAKINYNNIMKKLDEITNKTNNKYCVIFIGRDKENKKYYIEESNGIRIIKKFYLDSEKEVNDYTKDKEDNPNCIIIHCDIIP